MNLVQQARIGTGRYTNRDLLVAGVLVSLLLQNVQRLARSIQNGTIIEDFQRWVFRCLRRLPAVRAKIEADMQSTRAGFMKMFQDPCGCVPRSKLSKPISFEEVVKELDHFASLTGPYDQGQCSGMTAWAGESVGGGAASALDKPILLVTLHVFAVVLTVSAPHT